MSGSGPTQRYRVYLGWTVCVMLVRGASPAGDDERLETEHCTETNAKFGCHKVALFLTLSLIKALILILDTPFVIMN